MMKQIQLELIPQPGAKPEFLALLEIKDPSQAILKIWNELPPKIILQGYTKDGWAWRPSPLLQNITVHSVDGRQKLPGFIDYLKQRRKSAYCVYEKILFIISFVQNNMETVDCRVALDMTKLTNCSLKPNVKATVPQVPPPTTTTTAPPRNAGGFLGKLVGAQNRTNQHVANAAPVRKMAPPPTSTTTTEQSSVTPQQQRSASQVLADFRNTMNDKMLDFDISPEDTEKVTITLSDYTQGLHADDKEKITMDVLKYLVYEAAEEVNEEWIVHKEPTGFHDVAEFVIYKEGAAPPEVLEEINKGELPEEIKGQQRALQNERSRQLSQAEQKYKNQLESVAHRELQEEEDDFEALNQRKRDRRTMEDYEREKKRAK